MRTRLSSICAVTTRRSSGWVTSRRQPSRTRTGGVARLRCGLNWSRRRLSSAAERANVLSANEARIPGCWWGCSTPTRRIVGFSYRRVAELAYMELAGAIVNLPHIMVNNPPRKFSVEKRKKTLRLPKMRLERPFVTPA